jgi:hypothetical protein
MFIVGLSLVHFGYFLGEVVFCLNLSFPEKPFYIDFDLI